MVNCFAIKLLWEIKIFVYPVADPISKKNGYMYKWATRRAVPIKLCLPIFDEISSKNFTDIITQSSGIICELIVPIRSP